MKTQYTVTMLTTNDRIYVATDTSVVAAKSKLIARARAAGEKKWGWKVERITSLWELPLAGYTTY